MVVDGYFWFRVAVRSRPLLRCFHNVSMLQRGIITMLQFAAESSDEGVGMMSDDTDVKASSSSSPKPDAPPNDSACGDKSWEMELIQRQLIELRLAFDRERRLRLLYEEELRKRDINNLRVSGSLRRMFGRSCFFARSAPRRVFGRR